MRLYRFSPINTEEELVNVLTYIHFACHKLCKQTLGYHLSTIGNIGVFCHYEEEYDQLIKLRKQLTQESESIDSKYFRLHKPYVIRAEDSIPETTYTHLYIRKPDPYRHHVGDLDFFLEDEKYQPLKASIHSGRKITGARIFNRTDIDMLELYDPDVDTLAYVRTRQI